MGGGVRFFYSWAEVSKVTPPKMRCPRLTPRPLTAFWTEWYKNQRYGDRLSLQGIGGGGAKRGTSNIEYGGGRENNRTVGRAAADKTEREVHRTFRRKDIQPLTVFYSCISKSQHVAA